MRPLVGAGSVYVVSKLEYAPHTMVAQPLQRLECCQIHSLAGQPYGQQHLVARTVRANETEPIVIGTLQPCLNRWYCLRQLWLKDQWHFKKKYPLIASFQVPVCPVLYIYDFPLSTSQCFINLYNYLLT